MRAAAIIVLGASCLACRQDMHDAPRYEALERSDFFPDGRSARPQVAGTVARGELRLDTHLYEGKIAGELAASFPFAMDRAVLERGRERYAIFCSPCHGQDGMGDGMIVRRGFPKPPSLHEQRLVDAPPGHFFDVMTRGFGRMYDYADRVPVRDRWAIAGWVRVLQRAHRGRIEDVPEDLRPRLAEAIP